MTLWIPCTYNQEVNLQQTLASATADSTLAGDIEGLHHPITCRDILYVDDDNTIRCPHSKAPPSNPRNQAIFDASIAILLFQELAKKNL